MELIRLIIAGAALGFVSPAMAVSPSNFYQGKQIQFIIRAEPGGSYDLYMRTLAKYMVKYIPGNPVAVPVNMPGGGGLLALSYLDKIAPHDGTAVAMVTQTDPLEQALGNNPNLKTDLERLNWIGNVSQQNTFLVVRESSPTKSLNDATTRVTLLASSGASGSDFILANVMNSVLHTKFKSIIGYRSSPEMDLAIRRGEAEGRFTTNLQNLFDITPGGVKAFNIIVQIGTKADPSFPGAPLLKDLPSNEKSVLDTISDVMSLARPVATNSDVPPERVAVLRNAFEKTMHDPDFLKDSKRQQLDVSPWTWQQTQKVVSEIIHSSPETKRLLR